MLSILSTIPTIYAIPRETHALCPGGYSRDLASVGLPKPHRLDRDLAAAPAVCERWAEKSPKNVVFFRQILRKFPAARLIHMVRDGRDVVTSVYPERPGADPGFVYRRLVRNAVAQGGYYVPPGRWVADVAAGLHFEGHPSVLTVRYEDLVGGFEPTMRRVCEHIGEPWKEVGGRVLAYPEFAAVRRSGAWDRPATAMRPDGVGRWRRPEHSARVAELLAHPRAGRLLRRLGYLQQPAAVVS